MPDLDPSVAEAASIATSIEPVPADIEDEEDVETAMLFLGIFKEHHHLIDKSCRDFWKVVTDKCHDAGIYVGKDSTNMYMDIWPGFVEHSKANFQTDTQTEIDKIVMDIVVSRKPNSFVKKPPLTARQRAVANYHPPKIGIVEPEAQPINGRAKKATTNKPPPTTSRTPSRPPARAAMASSDQPLPNGNSNSRSNGNNVLVADPPPLPAALPPSALGFHDNRTPTETIIALMQGIQQGLAMQHSTGQHGHVSAHVRAPRAPAATHNAPRPIRNPAPRPAAPTVQVSAPPPAPPRPPPQPVSRPAQPPPAPQLPTVQESFTSVTSNPPPPVQPVPSNEAPPINANPKSAPSSSSESHSSKIPDNLNFLQYLIAGTTFNVPFGGFPALPSWMTLPPPPANATPFNLTPQQIHFEAMRTGMLMNQANPGYSFGGQTPQKLADLFGYAGAHSWVPNKAQPTPSQFGNENFPFGNKAGSIHSDTSSLKTGDFMNSLRSSNASRTSSSLFSTTSFDPFCFAHSSSSNTQTSPETLKTKAKSPQKPATPTFVEPLPRTNAVEKESTNSKSKPASKRASDENGNKKPREKSLSTTPKSKDKKSSKRKSANTPEGDSGSGSRTPVSKRRRQVSPRAPSPPKEPAPTTGKTPKKRGPKPKRQREQSASPPPCSSFAIPVRQSMRVAIRNSLYDDKSDVTTDDSSTSLATKARRTRSVAAPIFASRRTARSRTCAKLVISTDDDD
uniref:ARID domain-containing protein n=1 Tax=Panagrellus redivivus TaxID=6233 RepID=A0A7E4ZX39_PANRE